jgi:hypothetical protein
MKNILAENMLRFGTKNVSEADVKKKLTESTLKELDPGMANANKFFAAEWAKKTNGPQFATANLIYQAQPFENTDRGVKYILNIHKAVAAPYGSFSFIIPAFLGLADWFSPVGRDPRGSLSDSGDLQISADFNMHPQDLKSAADDINSKWNEFTPEVVKTHLTGRKAQPLFARDIASIKSSTKFALIGPMLTGNAKSVYDMIAAS